MTALALMLLSVASPPSANLERAMLLYQRLEFQRCLEQLDRTPKLEAQSEQALSELYRGLCGFHLRKRDAEEHLKAALTLDANVKLPPLTSPKIEAVFEKLKAEVQKSASPPPPPPVMEPQASSPPKDALVKPAFQPETPVAKRSMIPGWALVGTSVAALAMGIAFGVNAQQLAAKGRGFEFAIDAAPFASAAYTRSWVANISFGVSLVTVVTGVLLLVFR